eukprot:5857907-Amphidinium_carterae.1
MRIEWDGLSRRHAFGLVRRALVESLHGSARSWSASVSPVHRATISTELLSTIAWKKFSLQQWMHRPTQLSVECAAAEAPSLHSSAMAPSSQSTPLHVAWRVMWDALVHRYAARGSTAC